MRFSEEDVYIIGVCFALLVSVLITVPLARFILRWYWSHPRKESYKELISRCIFCLLLLGMEGYVIYRLFHYTSVILFAVIGSVLECLALYPSLKYLNTRLMAEYSFSFTEEEDKYPDKIRKYIICYLFGYILIQNVLLTFGGFGFSRWVMPDVVEVGVGVRPSSYSYKTSEYYVLPYAGGLRPGESYISNLSEDTVYRVVINYGIPGEDKRNYYAVNEKYPPYSLCRMSGRAIHVMDTIAPWMPVSYGRLGRYRTQRIYLTDGMHLYDFMVLEMRSFGLYGNKRVDTIEESRNKVLTENWEKYRAYKSIDPYPYPRLCPDSLSRFVRRRPRTGDNDSNRK